MWDLKESFLLPTLRMQYYVNVLINHSNRGFNDTQEDWIHNWNTIEKVDTLYFVQHERFLFSYTVQSEKPRAGLHCKPHGMSQGWQVE